jgi:four helix bundle protein
MSPNNRKNKKYDIKDRVFEFCKRILEIADLLPSTKACEIIRPQLIKSGTSIGANLEEGDGAISKRDFLNKVVLARKEAKETRFWLKLVSGKYVKKESIEDDIEELLEIIKILSTIILKTKNKKSSL